ncbi:hypothetical protein Tsubulata_009544 [Turnera subulata]|uniref:Pentacotripeptide-repeat region of PRORP domain-containing protein n=1 Tax=Turnera subulata TaxID=218843 RepID=A0A9Q0FL84_9ROSI|nr:hypothetical protein Tsubulata_009544 [Turnera subulata]
MNPRLLAKTLIKNQFSIFSRPYYTNRTNTVTLYSKISPLGSPGLSVVPELDNWIDNGKKVRVAELQRIIRDLRKRSRYTQALEVSEWMNQKGICLFSPAEHAVHLDLIGKVRGFAAAEDYFNNLRNRDKTDKTYGALLNCYVRQRQTEKAISHWEKMREMGFASTSLAYNDIMCLYTHGGQYEKVPDVLAEMKKNSVSPDNFSYRICINSYGVRNDIEGMERVLNEMEGQQHIAMDWNTYAVAANFYIKAGLADKAIDALKKSEEKLDKKEKDGTAYNHLISLYATLGSKAAVLRLWELQKSACKRRINRDYINVLKALVKLGEFEEAVEVLGEWESSGNCYDVRVPNCLVAGFAERGLCDEAKSLLEDLVERGKAISHKSWGIVAGGYLDIGELAKAFLSMKAALCIDVEGKEWKPEPRVITGILNWLGDEGSSEDAEAFVASLRNFIPMSREMYHALLKAKVREGKEVKGLLIGMRMDKLDENDETKKILSMRQV